jgi:predicted nucleotidyltransferase
MFPHHAETLQRIRELFSNDPNVHGLILGGSIAHGFCTAQSDVDVMIVVGAEDYGERLRTLRTGLFSRELATYAGGYVDGKYISAEFIRQVGEKGSEPARFAFKDAQLVFDRGAALAPLIEAAGRYPIAEKAARIARFQAQFEAWHWYTGEALKRQQLPLLRLAVAKLTLFGGRIILAQNELLYPYHKWFLRVLESAPSKPPGVSALIEELALAPDTENIARFATLLREFSTSWDVPNWGQQFLLESELNWQHGQTPVDDL